MSERDRQVQRVLVIEAGANLVVLTAKAAVGFATGSMVVLADAVHSLTDVANNAAAWIAMRIASQPPDREHPYGHRKFETLAVFVLAGLLTVTAFEIGLRALTRSSDHHVSQSGWGLAVMIGVLGVNVAVSAWERRQARKLDSEILHADARHTFGDVLTTIVVLTGWQLSAIGYRWLDTLFALGVALLVLYLAYGLFQRAVPVLVDSTAVAPELLGEAIETIPGVRDVSRVRSRWVGQTAAVDVVITIAPEATTLEGHEIADQVECALRERFDIDDVSVHVEPDLSSCAR